MAAANSVNPVGPNEENPQIQQMFDERLNAMQKMRATTADQLQQVMAENLQQSRSPKRRSQASGSGGRSTDEVRQRLEEFVTRFNKIVEKNPAFNIRIGLGVTANGDPLIRIIDKRSQETRETIPTSQSIKLASNMERFTDYFVQKFNQAGVLVDLFSK